MPMFPSKEADVAALAASVMAGLSSNPAVFPDPAVDLAAAAAQIEAYKQARAEHAAAVAAKEKATTAKQKAFEAVKATLKKQLRYAGNVTDFDDDKLKLLGWASRRPKSSAAPGQVRNLKALEQGTDFVVLSWMSPADGGRAGAYQIFRRDGRQGETWINAGVSIATKIKLTDQPRHLDLEYRVTALNKQGSGPHSNTVAVVL